MELVLWCSRKNRHYAKKHTLNAQLQSGKRKDKQVVLQQWVPEAHPGSTRWGGVTLPPPKVHAELRKAGRGGALYAQNSVLRRGDNWCKGPMTWQGNTLKESKAMWSELWKEREVWNLWIPNIKIKYCQFPKVKSIYKRAQY